jgi:glycosyltransferase involved in cell wall biosynthesis
MTQLEGVRVSILAPTFPRLPGGGARVFYEHAGALASAGCDVTVIHVLGYRRGPKRMIDAAKTRVRELQAGAFPRRIRWMSVDNQVKFAYVPRLGDSTRLPAADLRVGTFWRTTEFLSRWRGDGAPYMQLLQAYEVWAGPADKVDAVWRLPIHSAVVSRALYRRAMELGLPPKRVHVVPNGIDTALFNVTTPIASRPPTVAVLAHPAPVKGLAESVEVLNRVHAARPDVPMLAFGSNPRPGILPPFVKYRRGLSGSALVATVYDTASVFLCASQSEGWGFPSMEAMACGAALVSTRNGGVDDFAAHGESALLRDVGAVEGLAQDVLRLLDDDTERVRIASTGAESVRRFTWQSSGEAFVAAVAEALAAPMETR